MTCRPANAAPILALLFIVLALPGAYVGGYFWLGQSAEGVIDQTGKLVIWRCYPRPWHWVFAPAAQVEALIRGCRVNCQENPV